MSLQIRKGNWILERYYDADRVQDNLGTVVRIDKDQPLNVGVLISAAPEMLEALELVVSKMHKLKFFDTNNIISANDYVKIVDAIKKAKGEN